jgi:hypothetical protein
MYVPTGDIPGLLVYDFGLGVPGAFKNAPSVKAINFSK